ncbi:MAG: hypothetical protein R3C59_00415 [Planctomycetaceae bacterium]
MANGVGRPVEPAVFRFGLVRRFMRYFYPNLTFEDELQNLTARPTAAAQQTVHELAPVVSLLANADDTILLSAVPREADVPKSLRHARFVNRSSLASDSVIAGARHSSASGSPRHVDGGQTLVPWGWTPAARSVAALIGMPDDFIPAEAAVQQVNGRRFAARHDPVFTDHHCEFPFGQNSFGQLCRTVSEYETAGQRLCSVGIDRWVVKPQISHAGRNRLLVTGTHRNAQQSGWLTKHLKHPDGVYVEPWVTVREECGMQFEIGAAAHGGQIRLVGVTQLMNDPMGRYLGSVIRNDTVLEERWSAVIQHGFSVCRAVQQAGYFGPLGIDAFRYDCGCGRTVVRPCNDINARLTMGRVALSLRKELLPGEIGLWCHVVLPPPAQSPTECPDAGILQGTQATVQNFRKMFAPCTHDSEPEHKLPFELTCSDVRLVHTSPEQIDHQPVRLRTVLLAGPLLPRLLEVSKFLRSPSQQTTENTGTASKMTRPAES